jgi:hypothetical protein
MLRNQAYLEVVNGHSHIILEQYRCKESIIATKMRYPKALLTRKASGHNNAQKKRHLRVPCCIIILILILPTEYTFYP